MKKFFSVFVFVSMLVLPSFAISVPSTHVVSASWLNKHLNNVLVVNVSTPKSYAKGHIPGAVNMPKNYFFKGYMGNIKALVDTTPEVEALFRNAGISNNSAVVFVSHVKKPQRFANMTRVFWTAWVYGLRNMAILDGGQEAWVANGGKLSTALPSVKKGNFTVRSFDKGAIKSLIDVQSALVNKNVQLVDAREMTHFVGKDKDRRITRHGHILGAKKVSAYLFSKKVGKTYKLVTPAEAKAIIEKDGISLNKPIITYCNTGHLATGTWFVSKFLAGAKNVGIFDGSMVEYSRTSLPVAK